MFVKGDRVFINPGPYWEAGPYGGMWATVARSQTGASYPLTTVVPDGAAVLTGYTVKTARLTLGSRCTVVALRPRGVVAIREA